MELSFRRCRSGGNCGRKTKFRSDFPELNRGVLTNPLSFYRKRVPKIVGSPANWEDTSVPLKAKRSKLQVSPSNVLRGFLICLCLSNFPFQALVFSGPMFFFLTGSPPVGGGTCHGFSNKKHGFLSKGGTGLRGCKSKEHQGEASHNVGRGSLVSESQNANWNPYFAYGVLEHSAT